MLLAWIAYRLSRELAAGRLKTTATKVINDKRRLVGASTSLPDTTAWESSFLVMKINEKDVPPGTVFRDLEEIHNALESALPG